MKLTNTILILFLIVIVCIIVYQSPNRLTHNDIECLTDQWIKEVTINHDPEATYKLFCKNSNLVGTVSQVKRRDADIKRYFNYFAKLKGIEVVDKKYNISKVTDDVFVNTAFITWNWDGLESPIVARMTFIYKNNCIFQLHSSKMPDLNDSLVQISGLN